MSYLRYKFLAATALAAFVVLGLSPPEAKASAITVNVYIDGTKVDSFGGANFATKGPQTYTVGGTTFTGLSIIASSNQPGTATGNLAQVDITAFGSTGTGKLKVDVIETVAYTSPAGLPLILSSTIADSSQTSGGGSPTATTWQSWINNVAGLAGTTPGVQPGPGSSTATVSFPAGAPYFLANEMTMVAGDAAISFSGSTVVSAVPAPAGLVLVLTGMPVLAFGGWVRRRMLKKA